MKIAALLAGLIGIILVGCSNDLPTGVEQPQIIDATSATAAADALAATRTANDVQEKVAATLRASTQTTAPPDPTTESASTLSKVLDQVLPLSEDHYSKGTYYAKDGQYENAIQEFDQAIQLDPDHSKAYYNRGISYFYLGQDQTAINDYTKAIQLNPDDADAYNNRGVSYENLGQYQTAINDYTKAIQLDPYDASAYYNRGISYSALGQDQTAINDYTKAIQLDPYDAGAYYRRGIAYRNLGQYQTANADDAITCLLESSYC